MLTPQHSPAIHLAQIGDKTAEKKGKNTVQQNGKVQPEILSKLKEMWSNMALLNDLRFLRLKKLKSSYKSHSAHPHNI